MKLNDIPNSILFASLYCISRGHVWPLLKMEKYKNSAYVMRYKDKEIELYKRLADPNLEKAVKEKIEDFQKHLDQTKQKCEENYKNSEFKDKGEFIPYIKEEYFVKGEVDRYTDILTMKNNFEKLTSYFMEQYSKKGFPFVHSIFVPSKNAYNNIFINRGNVYLLSSYSKDNFEEIYNSKTEGLKFSKIRKLYENQENISKNNENNDEKE